MKSQIAVLSVLLVLPTLLSGCIVNLDSCEFISYSIKDENGYPVLSLYVNVSGNVVIKLVGTDGAILDEEQTVQGMQIINLSMADYHRSPSQGIYRVVAYDRYGNSLSGKNIAVSTPQISIVNIEPMWWLEGAGKYYLIGASINIFNSGNAPAYIKSAKIEIDGSKTSTAQIYESVIQPKENSSIYACFYISEIPRSEHAISVDVFDADDNTIASASFTDSPFYNPYMKKFHTSWSYDGRRFSVSIPVPEKLLETCSSIKRPPVEDYSYYVIFPYDDNYISMIADKLSSLYSAKSDEDRINFIASFAQSINYEAEKGEYPQFPVELLENKSGDCEDKAIFTSAVLSTLGYDVVLIRLPEHMVAGVHLNNTDYSGKTYYEDSSGRKYLFLETSNIGWKLGEAKEEYRNTANHTLYHITSKPILLQECESPIRYTSINRDYVVIDTRVRNIGTADAHDVHISITFISQYDTEIDTESSGDFSVDAGSEKQIHLEVDCPGASFKKVKVSIVYKDEKCFESTFLFG